MTQPSDLELKDEIHAAELEWTVQRAGWVAMLLLVVCALLGLFGTGPVDRAHIKGDAMEVTYSRFLRTSTSAGLDLTLPASRTDATGIWLDRPYTRHFEITSVTPQPQSATSSKDRLLYVFRTVPGQPLAVTFHLRVSEGAVGILSATVGVDGGAQTHFSQFIWP